MREINLASLNCRGLSELKKRRDVLNFLKKQNYDVLFLQETHLIKESSLYFDSLWKGKCFHSCYTNRSRGVTIMIRNSLPHEIIKVERTDAGNYIIVVCKLGTQTYLFANIYGPNDDDPNFYSKFTDLLDSFQTDHVIIGGDFNFVIEPNVDSFNYAREYNTNAKRNFLNFAQSNELIDIWRVKNPNSLEYTWSRTNPLKCGRLDMFFVNTELIESIPRVTIKPGYRTDHSCLTMTVQVMEIEKGPGIWKLNESILKNSEYIELVNSTIKNTVYQYAIPVYNIEYLSDSNNYENIDFTIKESLFYETLLMLIRGETVQYCKRIARTRRRKENELLVNVQSAQTAFDHDKCDEKARILQKAKENLEEHRKPYIEGLIVRSRTQWHEEGERSSKYFLSLEKRNATKKSIQYIENEGKTITNSRAILSLFTHTLRKKYTDQGYTEPDFNFIRRNLSEVLTEKEKNALDEELTFQELTTALRGMKKGRTPGSNGFSVDFFSCFWKTLGVFLYRACISSFSEGTTVPSHRESLITLIPKPGRPNNSLKSWRPISLLNVDYKIISTAIANRFKKVVNKIISTSQTAYIKGRYIGENSRLVYDVISHVNQSKQTCLILAADFEAAFETISWYYLNAVLKEMNFGEYFRQLVNLLYLNQNNFSRILLNGFLGEKIYMHKGIRQGDPVSGFLFDIAVEILSKQISQSKNLTGIKVNTNTEIRVSQYADDTILFLDGTKRSLNGTAIELMKFSTQSGLKVNWDKTTCLPLGGLSPVKATENDFASRIRWVNEIKILGLYFRNNITNITDLNLEKKLGLLENDIAQWKRRHITPLGKITVIKSLLLAKLVHIFMALPNPSNQ